LKKIILVLTLFCSIDYAQTKDSIFPALQGEQLLDSLIAYYKPNTVLSYNGARDKMYAIIYNVNDTLEGVYTGYKVYVPYNSSNPRTYTNAANPIMNCEHTWPQSLGASGNAESDMHHLFATNGNANAARGNLPFDEINDQLTDKWWKGVSFITSVPSIQIDKYSEEDTGIRFEPREEHKGNVARAMFYFYTMYKEQADAINPNFFIIQKDILRQWHIADPADALEISRTNQIASYQDNKPNPYVLDATLVERAYFSSSVVDEDKNVIPKKIKLFQNYPNPFNAGTTLRYYIPSGSEVFLQIFDILGKEVYSENKIHHNPGLYSYNWTGIDNSGKNVGSGVYFYRIVYMLNSKTNRILGKNEESDIKKMILLQ